MARKIQGRFTNESEYLRAVARNNSLYSDEVYSNLLSSQGSETANAFAQATIQAQKQPSVDFDDSTYKLLDSDDKFGYLMTEYYMDHNSEDYSKNMTYFNEKKEAAIRQINYESLNDLEKTFHSIGGWFAQLGVSLYSTIENLIDLTSTIWEGQVRMFGLNDVGDAIRDFTNRDITGAKAAQESINEYVSAYTVWDKSIVGNIGLGVASAIGQLAPAFIPGVGQAVYWMSMAGGSINDALDYDPDLGYGALLAYTSSNLAIEAATEAISGKMFGGGNVLDNIILGTGKRAGVGAIANIGINMFSEGLEEVTSELVGSLTNYIIGREPDVTLENVLVAGAIGALMGGSMAVVDIASTQNLYTVDGDVVSKQGLAEATVRAKKDGKEINAKKLSKSKSYSILQAIAASDTASLNAAVSSEFKRNVKLDQEGVKNTKKSERDAQKAHEQSVKQQETNIKAAERLAFLLKTVGVKDFAKGVDLLKRTADDVVSGVEAWKNRFNGTTAVEKRAQQELIAASGCGVSIQDRATYSPEQKALAKTIRDEYGKTVIFGKISDENGHTRLNVSTHDYVFLDEADFKAKGLQRSIETTVKNALVEELMQSDLKLDNKKLKSIFQKILGSKNIDFSKDFTQEQMHEVASKLLFDELSIDKVLQMDTGLFAGVSRWNRKRIDELKNQKKTPTKQYEYNTLLKIRERYLNRIAKTCGRIDDIEDAKEMCQLTDAEYKKVSMSLKPNALNSSIRYFRTNLPEELHAKHAVINLINNAKLPQYQTKPGDKIINWDTFGDANTYSLEFRNTLRDFQEDSSNKAYAINDFDELLTLFILKQTGFVVSLTNRSVYKAVDMKKAMKTDFVDKLRFAKHNLERRRAIEGKLDELFYTTAIDDEAALAEIQDLESRYRITNENSRWLFRKIPLREVFSEELLKDFDSEYIDSVVVEFGDLPDGAVGMYDHVERKIVLPIDNDIETLLDTIYHEGYHALSISMGGPTGTNDEFTTNIAEYLDKYEPEVFERISEWVINNYATENIHSITELYEAIGDLFYYYDLGELLAEGDILKSAVKGDYFYFKDGVFYGHGIFEKLLGGPIQLVNKKDESGSKSNRAQKKTTTTEATAAKKTEDEESRAKNTIKKLRAKYPTQTELKKAGFGRQTLNTLFGEKKPLFSDIWTVVLEDTENTTEAKDELIKTLYAENKNINSFTKAVQTLRSSGDVKEKGYITNPGPSIINLSLAYSLIYDAVVNDDYSWVDSLLRDAPEADIKEFKDNLRQAIQDGFGNKLISAIKSSGKNYKMSPKSLIITLLGSVDGSQYELNHNRYEATKTFIRYIEFLLNKQNNPDTEIIKWLISNDYDFTVTSAKKLIKRLRKGLQANLESAESEGMREGHDDSETSVYALELDNQQEEAYMEAELNLSSTSESWSVSEAVRYIDSHVMSFDDIVEFVRELNFNENDTKELAKQLKLDSEKTNVLLDLRLLSAEELSYFADEMGMTEKEARKYASDLNINSDMLNSLSENAETLGLSLKDYMTQETVKQQRRILSNIDKSKNTIARWLFAPSGEKTGVLSSFITSLRYLQSTANDSSEQVKQAIEEKASPEYFIDILKDAVSRAATTEDLISIYNRIKAQTKLLKDFYGEEGYKNIAKYAGVRKENVKNRSVDEIKASLGLKSSDTTESLAKKQTPKRSNPRKGKAVKLSGINLYEQLTITIDSLKKRIADKQDDLKYPKVLYNDYGKQIEKLESSKNLSKDQEELLTQLKDRYKELDSVLKDGESFIQELENQIETLEAKRNDILNNQTEQTENATSIETSTIDEELNKETSIIDKAPEKETSQKTDLIADIEAEIDAILAEQTEAPTTEELPAKDKPEEPATDTKTVADVDKEIENAIAEVEEVESEVDEEELYYQINELLAERDVLVLDEQEVEKERIKEEIENKGKMYTLINELNDSTYRTDPTSPFYKTRESATKGKEGTEYVVASYETFLDAKKYLLNKIKTAEECIALAQAITEGKIHSIEADFLSTWLYTRIRLFPNNTRAINAIKNAQNATETAQKLAARQKLGNGRYRVEKTVADITKEYEATFQPSEELIREAVPELTVGNEAEYVEQLNKKIEKLEQEIEEASAYSIKLEKTLEKERLEQEATLVATQDYIGLLSHKIEELENKQTDVSENMEKASQIEQQIVNELVEFAKENQDKKKLPDNKESKTIFSPQTAENIRRKLHTMESFRYLALLSNPSTWARNAITNTLVVLQEKLVDVVSKGMGSFLDKNSASYIKQMGFVGDYSNDFHNFMKEKFTPKLMIDTEGSSYNENAYNRTKQRFMEENNKLRNSKALGWLYRSEKWGLKDQKWLVDRTVTNLCNMYAGSRQFLMKELVELLKPKFGITSKDISVPDIINIIKKTDTPLASQLESAYNNDLSALVTLTETYNKDRAADIYDKALFRANELLFKTDNFLTNLKAQLNKSSPAAGYVLGMLIPFARTTVNTGLYMLSHSPIGIAQGLVRLLKYKTSNLNDMRIEITEYYKNQYNDIVNKAKEKFEEEQKLLKEQLKEEYKETKFKPQDFKEWLKDNASASTIAAINGNNKNIKQIFESMMNEGKVSGITIGLNDLYGKAESMEKFSQGIVGTGALVLGLIMSAILDVDIDEDDFLGPVINVPTLNIKIQLSSLAPFSTVFTMGALFGSTTSFNEYMSAIWSVYVDQSVLGTIDSALKYSDSVSDFAQNTIINYVQQYIPSAIKSVTKIIDRSKKDKSGSFRDKLVNTTLSNIPGLSYLVANKINPYTGESQKYYQSILGAIIGGVNPITMRSTKQTEFETIAEQLGAVTTGLSGRFEINGKVYNVTDKNKEELAKYRAEYIRSEYEKISSGKKLVTVETEDGKRITTKWNKLNDEQKQRVLKGLYSDASNVSKVRYWVVDLGNTYKTSNKTEYQTYYKLFGNRVQYDANWSKSKFLER